MWLLLPLLLFHSIGLPVVFCEHMWGTEVLLRRSWRGLKRIAGTKATRRVVLHRRAAGGALRGSAGDDQLLCSCDCCDVVARRPDEASAGVGVKCSPSVEHSQDVCGEQCRPGENDLVFRVAEEQSLDYQRFCFFECKPAAGILSPVRTQCIALDSADVRRVLDPGGNAMDPAFLYSRPSWPGGNPAVVPPLSIPARLPSQSLLAANSKLHGNRTQQPAVGVPPSGASVPGSPDAVDPEEALKKANGEGGLAETMGAVSVEAARSLGSLQANASLAEAARSLDPYAVVADLHAAALGATSAAAGATIAAEQAAQSYKLAAKSNWMIALEAAKAEVLRWNATAAAKPASDKLKAENSWQRKAAEAAHEASQPWISALLRAQKDIKDYTTEAYKVAKQAVKLEEKGKQLAWQANQIRNTNPVEAEGQIEEARDTVMEGQRLTLHSRQLFDVMEKIRKNVPQYRYQAQVAASHAVSELRLSRR